MIRFLSTFWLRHIYSRLVSPIAAIGIFGLASCLIILFVVATIADEVLEKESFAFDRSLLLWIHSFANPNLDRVMLVITHLGNPNIVTTFVLASLGILYKLKLESID